MSLFSSGGANVRSRNPRKRYFSNLVSQAGQQSFSPAKLKTAAQSVFGGLQQKLLGPDSNSNAVGASVTAQLLQVGQDLKSGNLPAAQADFGAFKMTLAQHVGQLLNHSTSGSSSSAANSSSTGASSESSLLSAGTDPLAAAMLAYGSLQQGVINGALNASDRPQPAHFQSMHKRSDTHPMNVSPLGSQRGERVVCLRYSNSRIKALRIVRFICRCRDKPLGMPRDRIQARSACKR